MNTLFNPLFATLVGLLRSRAILHLEILALRQQLAMVAHQDQKRICICRTECFFGYCYTAAGRSVYNTLQVFKPDTHVRWHRSGFRFYWHWKLRCGRGCRPSIKLEIKQLIRTMSRDNVGWGAPQIHGELAMLGSKVSQATVAKYMHRFRKPLSQTWRTFLDNHVTDLVSLNLRLRYP